MIEKCQRMRRGDVLRNDWAGEENPYKYTMYIRKGKHCGHTTIDCLSYDGKIVRHGEQDNRLVVVGHLKEYDDFICALKNIKGGIQV